MNNLRYPQLFLHELNKLKANVSFHIISTPVAVPCTHPPLPCLACKSLNAFSKETYEKLTLLRKLCDWLLSVFMVRP